MLGVWKSEDYTKTTSIMVCILGLPLSSMLFSGYKFRDAYLDDHGKEEDYKEEFLLYLKFIKDPTKKLHSAEQAVRNFKLRMDYVDHYMIDEDLIIVYRIPTIYISSMMYFRIGQYSKMNRVLAAQYLLRTDIRHHIINKTKEQREAIERELDIQLDEESELADPPNPEKEILRFNKEKYKEWKL